MSALASPHLAANSSDRTRAAPAAPSIAASAPTSALMRAIGWAALLAAVLDLGLMAGFFSTYSINVNLATMELDGPTYALVQSAFNRNVRHPVFFVAFFGPPLWCALALAASWRERGAWWWLTGAVAIGYAVGIIAFTRGVNLPLNYTTESWTAATLPTDWTATRDAWNAANDWRSICNTVLFAAGLGALVMRARA